jgi:hypothetical protein
VPIFGVDPIGVSGYNLLIIIYLETKIILLIIRTTRSLYNR